jgi:tripartite-type tricarboxylate transporter receptor subunit TctC
VRDAVAAAIAEVLSKPDSKTRQFIEKQYPPGPVLIAGDALTAQLKANLVANQELLKATGQ